MQVFGKKVEFAQLLTEIQSYTIKNDFFAAFAAGPRGHRDH
jgi:hypothetical protein